MRNKVIYDICEEKKKNGNIIIEINKNVKKMRVLKDLLKKYYNKRKNI